MGITLGHVLRHASQLKTLIGGDVEGRIGRPRAEHNAKIMKDTNKK